MNILMLSTSFIPSVMLCGHCQLEYLEKQGLVNYQFVPSHFVKRENVEWADIILFLRSDSDIDAYISKVAKQAKKKLVYIMDDDLLNVPDYLSSSPYYLLPSTKNNIKTIMSNCDTFLTPSVILMEKYGKQFKHSFLIDEPSLNRIEIKTQNKKVKVGFAGSIDRTQDINEILSSAIRELHKKYKDSIEIEFMGAKPDIVDELGLTYYPYQDGYDSYTAFMAKCNWDIGLAPMPETEFHKCKYYNKYVEYASFGIAGVYTDCVPYSLAIRSNENGVLVKNNTDSWVDAVSRLIDDRNIRKHISDECLKEANEKYTLEILSKDYYEKVLTGACESDSSYHIPDLTFIQSIIFFKRVFRKIKEHGLYFPKWLKEKVKSKLLERAQIKRYKNNKKKLKSIISKRKTIFIFAPYYEGLDDDYNKRIRCMDDYFRDHYKVYFSGESKIAEHLEVDLINNDHAYIECNSYDLNQANEVLNIISVCRNCLIHGVTRFMSNKISGEMYKLFDIEGVMIYWDTHGKIPEYYHNMMNYHTEAITNDIEKVFYNSVDVIICESNEEIDHFIKKYGKRDIQYIVYPMNDK